MKEPPLQRVLEPELMDTEQDASEYEAMDHTEANTAVVDRLIELGAHGRMLDIGTGPGHLPVMICERIPDAFVTGIDLAEHMLVRAERRRAQSAFADRLDFRLADAKGLGFEDASFDVVYSNTIVHHIPDPRDLLLGAKRVLKPGGVLLIRDLYRPESMERLQELVELHARDATPYQRKLFGDSLHAALTVDELRGMALDVGLEQAEIVVDTDRHMSLQIAAD